MSDSIVLPEPDSARPDGLAWWSGSLKHSVTRLANGEVRLSCQPDGPAVDDPRALGLALIAAADYSTPARPLAVGDTVSRDDVSRLQVWPLTVLGLPTGGVS